MIEQTADAAAFDAGVGAEEILTVEVVELFAFRTFGEADAALVTGRRPRVFMVVLVVFPDRLHQRRQKQSAVAFDRGLNAVGQKFRTVFKNPGEFAGHLHDFTTHGLRSLVAVGQQKHRNHVLTLLDFAEQRNGLRLFADFQHHVAGDQETVNIHIGHDQRFGLAVAGGVKHGNIAFLKRVGQAVDRAAHGRGVENRVVFNN